MSRLTTRPRVSSLVQGRREDPIAAVGTKLRRVFLERGLDYFEAEKAARPSTSRQSQNDAQHANVTSDPDESAEQTHHMTPEELFKMRVALAQPL